ncbi:unnamed protein product [Ectocarpus sp. 4 AP-2014]
MNLRWDAQKIVLRCRVRTVLRFLNVQRILNMSPRPLSVGSPRQENSGFDEP